MLLCLVLAPLLLAPALGEEEAVPRDYWWFDYYHSNWFTERTLDCTMEMNRKQPHSVSCIPSGIIILGDISDRTPSSDVNNICWGEGTSAGRDLFTSDKSFRVAKCQLQNRYAITPHCIYKAKITTGQITVACKQGYPVRLEGSLWVY